MRGLAFEALCVLAGWLLLLLCCLVACWLAGWPLLFLLGCVPKSGTRSATTAA